MRFHSSNFKNIRRQVYKRDKYTCQMPSCNCRVKKYLQIHHIVKYSSSIFLRESSSNLITLCSSCHRKIKGKEEYYVTIFTEIVQKNENNSG